VKVLLSKHTNEVAIIGNSAQWRQFVIGLSSGATTIACDVVQPSPYEASAEVIRINQSDEALLSISILDEKTLAVEGNREAVDWFTNFVEAFANSFPPGSHVHLDSLGNERLMNEDSCFTVLQMTDI
jgi:hypothetical protein